MKIRINLFILLIMIMCMILSSCARIESNDNSPTPTEVPDTKPDPAPDLISESSSLLERSQELLNKMSIEEKVGQMFIVRCPKQDAAKKAAQYHIGGYILFSKDFKN
ncbi:MAG: hypothetical protein GX236_04690, partial [Clostridiaceae bacterium]|nr:hypothetical protein [Clostridiaceae bacterium]